MRWAEITIRTTEEASEAISEMLAQVGCDGIAVTDPFEFKNTVENDPLSYADDGIYNSYGTDVVIRAYFAELDDGFVRMGAKNEEFFNPEGIGTIYGNISGKTMKTEDAVEFVKARLADIGQYLPVGIGFDGLKYVKDEDWANNWKKYYKEFKISDRVAICPSWLDPDSIEAEHKIILDPGSAFGTGTHETTSMCAKLIDKYMSKGAKVLDLGTGSGILAIVSLLYGASHVVGTDIAPECEATCHENLEKNRLPGEAFDIYIGDLTKDRDLQEKVGFDAYDIVTANILADIIIPMAPAAGRAIRKGGVFITSGIINFRKDDVREALEQAGFTVLDEVAEGEWFSIVCRK